MFKGKYNFKTLPHHPPLPMYAVIVCPDQQIYFAGWLAGSEARVRARARRSQVRCRVGPGGAVVQRTTRKAGADRQTDRQTLDWGWQGPQHRHIAIPTNVIVSADGRMDGRVELL